MMGVKKEKPSIRVLDHIFPAIRFEMPIMMQIMVP